MVKRLTWMLARPTRLNSALAARHGARDGKPALYAAESALAAGRVASVEITATGIRQPLKPGAGDDHRAVRPDDPAAGGAPDATRQTKRVP
jgi:hypothetical protein